MSATIVRTNRIHVFNGYWCLYVSLRSSNETYNLHIATGNQIHFDFISCNKLYHFISRLMKVTTYNKNGNTNC